MVINVDLLLFLYIYIYMYECFTCLCVHGALGYSAQGGQKGASEPLDLHFPRAVSCHVGEGPRLGPLQE